MFNRMLEQNTYSFRISLALITYVCFTYSYQIIQALIGDTSLYAILAFIGLLLVPSYLSPLKTYGIHIVILWIGFAIFVTFTNHYYYSGVFRYGILICAIMTMVTLTQHDNWQETAVKLIFAIGLLHVAATLVFFLSNTLYQSLMLPLWTDYPVGTLDGTKGYTAGLTSHYSFNGIYCSMTMIVQSALIIHKKLTKNRVSLMKWSIAALTLTALLLTEKRAHVLFSLLALLLTYIIFSRNKAGSKLLKITVVLSTSILAFIIVAAALPAVSSVFTRFVEQEDITTGRIDGWKVAWDVFLKFPLFGAGWFGFQDYFPSYQLYQVHNVYLQLLCECGIVGFTIAVAAMFVSLRNCFVTYRIANNDKDKEMLFVASALQIFVLIYNLTGTCLTDITLMFYFITCAIGYSYQLKYWLIKRNKEKLRGDLHFKCSSD